MDINELYNTFSPVEVEFLTNTLDCTVDGLINMRLHVLKQIVNLGWSADAITPEDPWEGSDDDGLTDIEADRMTLASAGMGTDEDYGYFGGDEY